MTDIVKVALIGGVCGAIPSIGAVILGVLNRAKLGDVETKVDGRLTQLLELTRASSHAEGEKAEKEKHDG
jgi:hypothetical protein